MNARLTLLACLLLLSLRPACSLGADAVPPAPSAAMPPALSGRWRWTFTMPDGTVTHPTVSLRWDGARLSGRTKFRSGSYAPISKAASDGTSVAFSVSRTVNGGTATTRYAGVLQGSVIRGKIESDWAGELQTYPWEATRLPDTPEGAWKWERTAEDRKLEVNLKARLEGEKVTGQVRIRRATAELEHGKFKEGMLTFETRGKLGGESFHARYEGRLIGDTIEGKEVIKIGKQEQTLQWSAERDD